MNLLALSHTHVEHQIYDAMRNEISRTELSTEAFSARRLMVLTGIGSSSTVRRGLRGLLEKQSIERVESQNSTAALGAASYTIFSPEAIFSRRRDKGLPPFPKEIECHQYDYAFDLAIKRLVGLAVLSRREAQVALSCSQGLTNLEIAKKLNVTVQTVKFHLRHIFVKFGVGRRTELIYRMLKLDGDSKQ